MENTLTKTESLLDLKNKLKIKFPSLTEADLNFDENKRDEALNYLRVKLGKTQEEWATIIAIL